MKSPPFPKPYSVQKADARTVVVPQDGVNPFYCTVCKADLCAHTEAMPRDAETVARVARAWERIRASEIV